MESGIEVRRLHAEDYDEALDFLNMVFSMAGRPHDFLRVLPRMWARDDERMGKHIAVFREGKIRSMLGVYPLPVEICGRKLLFSTVGNVATHPYDEGRGYMSLLLGEAMKRLDEIGADASRLSGIRQRYGRYGYEPVGLQYTFTLTGRNAKAHTGAQNGKIVFREIGPQDTEFLLQAQSMQRRSPMFCERGEIPDFYRTLSAWESRAAAAFKDGRMIGYLAAEGKNQEMISECIAESDEAAADILCGWLTERKLPSIKISVEAWRVGLIRLLSEFCEGWSSASPCRFYLRSWDKLTDALLALKSSMAPLPSGEAVIGIEGWGALHIRVDEGGTFAQRTDREPELLLRPDQAAQLLMGSLPPESVCSLPARLYPLFAAWFPLPLSWCTLDRV